MERLRTTPEQLKSQASRLQSQGEIIGGFVEKMINLVESIGATTWSGDAANTYKGQFDELNDDARRMKEFLNDTYEKLNQIAEIYQQTEDTNMALANSLPADVF